eukprot:1644345-Rhodomonas_salina.1
MSLSTLAKREVNEVKDSVLHCCGVLLVSCSTFAGVFHAMLTDVLKKLTLLNVVNTPVLALHKLTPLHPPQEPHAHTLSTSSKATQHTTESRLDPPPTLPSSPLRSAAVSLPCFLFLLLPLRLLPPPPASSSPP